jgi:hypothetical protein
MRNSTGRKELPLTPDVVWCIRILGEKLKKRKRRKKDEIKVCD